jgi:hypothetical protein
MLDGEVGTVAYPDLSFSPLIDPVENRLRVEKAHYCSSHRGGWERNP